MKYHIIIFVGHRRLAVLVSNEFQTATWYQPRIMLFLINMKSTKTNLIIATLEGNNKYKTLKRGKIYYMIYLLRLVSRSLPQ